MTTKQINLLLNDELALPAFWSANQKTVIFDLNWTSPTLINSIKLRMQTQVAQLFNACRVAYKLNETGIVVQDLDALSMKRDDTATVTALAYRGRNTLFISIEAFPSPLWRKAYLTVDVIIDFTGPDPTTVKDEPGVDWLNWLKERLISIVIIVAILGAFVYSWPKLRRFIKQWE
jgi:hypothetical protein